MKDLVTGIKLSRRLAKVVPGKDKTHFMYVRRGIKDFSVVSRMQADSIRWAFEKIPCWTLGELIRLVPGHRPEPVQLLFSDTTFMTKGDALVIECGLNEHGKPYAEVSYGRVGAFTLKFSMGGKKKKYPDEREGRPEQALGKFIADRYEDGTFTTEKLAVAIKAECEEISSEPIIERKLIA